MLHTYLEEAIALHKAILADQSISHIFNAAVQTMLAKMRSGGKIFAIGNGGSAADAQHFTAEFVGRYKLERRAYPALALTTDSSVLTAWSNDYAFDTVFSRQVEALGNGSDVLVALSTSGNSANIIRALHAAKKIGMATIALLGKDGGKTKGIADFEIVIPSRNTPRIQEAHKLILHSIAEEIEKQLAIEE